MVRPIHPLVVDVYARVFANRLKLPVVLKRAKVCRQSWWRWTQGVVPRLESLDRISTAIDQLIEEKDAKNGE